MTSNKLFNVYGKKSFCTKNEATLFFQEILNAHKNKPGLEIHSHFEELQDLLFNHSQSGEKCGCGINYFYVDKAPTKFGGHCFYVCRLDSSCTDFSYTECLRNSTSKSSVMRAMRRAVEHNIWLAKQKYFETHAENGFITCIYRFGILSCRS